jgi:hypothetical protein
VSFATNRYWSWFRIDSYTNRLVVFSHMTRSGKRSSTSLNLSAMEHARRASVKVSCRCRLWETGHGDAVEIAVDLVVEEVESQKGTELVCALPDVEVWGGELQFGREGLLPSAKLSEAR